jgi:hypothetical protein
MTRALKSLLAYCAALIAVVFAGLIGLACTNAPTTADNGSGTGVGNGIIIGKISYSDATPVRAARVLLRPQNFLADTSGVTSALQNDSIKTVGTDSNGVFRIDSLDTGGSYCIEVNDRRAQAEGTLYKINGIAGDTVRLPDRTAAAMAAVQGSVLLSGLPQNAYIQIFGLDKVGRTDSLGRFEIGDLPSGDCGEGECEYQLRILIPLANGGFRTESAELELANAVNGVISVELEYAGMNGPAND